LTDLIWKEDSGRGGLTSKVFPSGFSLNFLDLLDRIPAFSIDIARIPAFSIDVARMARHLPDSLRSVWQSRRCIKAQSSPWRGMRW